MMCNRRKCLGDWQPILVKKEFSPLICVIKIAIQWVSIHLPQRWRYLCSSSATNNSGLCKVLSKDILNKAEVQHIFCPSSHFLKIIKACLHIGVSRQHSGLWFTSSWYYYTLAFIMTISYLQACIDLKSPCPGCISQQVKADSSAYAVWKQKSKVIEATPLERLISGCSGQDCFSFST